ncbi:MAG: stage II sporulation protein E [Candidatus Auribacter fodinae]|uniref:Stage II sporulation protein E n=1 Tax=Candidatus Auribacter fodinae TaxID=2093366 RepID=A0A3A4QRX6_9BACT|nr:MAG: stage II sporulation protein E [Candidatus Auribacter fodinae]
MTEDYFLEVDYYQGFKHNQMVGGDVFLSHKIKEENRIISVLSDGLGSGIKASVLATLTSTMASTFVSNYIGVKETAEIIMRTLPVCRQRKISYSTFSIVDIDSEGNTRIIEYDNPGFILIRNGMPVKIEKSPVKIDRKQYRDTILKYASFKAQKGDRIILCSDGVSQSGMGTPSYPLGWGEKEVEKYVLNIISENSGISARDLAKRIVNKAMQNDSYKCKDDTTCGVIFYRKPRRLLVVTGPPIDKERDSVLANMVESFEGNKIICGGTTANIVSRELKRSVTVNIRDLHPDIPPTSDMKGIDLVTEGIITLGKVAELLENSLVTDTKISTGADKIVNMMLNNDIIHFVVGTKINEVHQDPNMPVELEIRRNVVKKIMKLLEDKHLKETKLQFI